MDHGMKKIQRGAAGAFYGKPLTLLDAANYNLEA